MATRVRALGEIALRVSDLPRARRFYDTVLGLDLLGEFPHAVFYRIGPVCAGHTQAFVLFDRSAPVNAGASTLDHVAFTIHLTDFEPERERLEALGLTVRVTQHAWVQWRSLYIQDPDGNQVEFVCHDPSL